MTAVVISEAEHSETRQERAERRITLLRSSFQTMFETLADIYRDEDWRYVNDQNGTPYTGFTSFVQDHLGCAASNARRYKQGISGLVLPLQELTAPGTRIPVTSADVARLGVTGARVVVEEAPAALEGIGDNEQQTAALRDLINSVTKRSSSAEFGPVRTPDQAEIPARPTGSLVPAGLPSGAAAEAQQPTSDDTDNDLPLRSYPKPRPEHEHGDDIFGAPPSSHAELTQNPKMPSTRSDDTSPTPTKTTAPDTHTAATELTAAITALLQAPEPTVLAEHMSTNSSDDCLRAAQKLARLGQLLRGLGS